MESRFVTKLQFIAIQIGTDRVVRIRAKRETIRDTTNAIRKQESKSAIRVGRGPVVINVSVFYWLLSFLLVH